MAALTFEQTDTVVALADKLLADARKAGEAMGTEDPDCAALTALQMAFAQAGVDLMGVEVTRNQEVVCTEIAVTQLRTAISGYRRLRIAERREWSTKGRS